MFCVHCGTQNPEFGSFCRKCGLALVTDESARNVVAEGFSSGQVLHEVPRTAPTPEASASPQPDRREDTAKFEETYSKMTDSELMNLARDKSTLVAQAKDALTLELRGRNTEEKFQAAYSTEKKQPPQSSGRPENSIIKIGAVILILIGASNGYRAILLAGARFHSTDQESREYLLGLQIALWLGFGLLCLVGYGLFRLRKWAFGVFLCLVLPLALTGPFWSFLLYLIFAGFLYSLRHEFQ